MRPRVVLVGRGPYRLPLDDAARRRFDALSQELDWVQIGTYAPGSASGDPRFRLAPRFPVRALDGVAYHAALPFRIARALRDLRADALLVQGAQETALALLGRAVARSRAAVILDIHGDWRVPTRLYGSSLRRVLNPLADRLARAGLRHADGVRTVSPYTTALAREAGVEPVAEFPAYMDFASFTDLPVAGLPAQPAAVFVGSLERNKGFDVLAGAWRQVVATIPEARLHVVGDGSLAPLAGSLAAELPAAAWDPLLPQPEVARALDAATVLVLPSLSEGMGRVVIEAFCRGRGVVATRVGGIPDLVRDGETGVLVPPGDPDALADALVRVLGDRSLQERLSEAASASAARWVVSPEEFARRVRALVDTCLAGRRP